MHVHLVELPGIDSVTAMPNVVPEKHTVPPGRWVRYICPADVGV